MQCAVINNGRQIPLPPYSALVPFSFILSRLPAPLLIHSISFAKLQPAHAHNSLWDFYSAVQYSERLMANSFQLLYFEISVEMLLIFKTATKIVRWVNETMGEATFETEASPWPSWFWWPRSCSMQFTIMVSSIDQRMEAGQAIVISNWHSCKTFKSVLFWYTHQKSRGTVQ